MAKKETKSNGLVEYKPPRDSRNKSGEVVAGLNGKIWRLKCGVKHMIPWEVREIFRHSEDQDNNTSEMIAAQEEEFLDKTSKLQ